MIKSKANIKKTAVLVMLCIVMALISCSYYPPGKEKAEDWLAISKDELNTVVDYLKNYDYSEIMIREADGTMKLILSETVKIENEEVNDAIKKLLFRGYKCIIKSEEDNVIYFPKWSRFTDFGAGLAYSIDGENEPILQYLTKLESLSEDNWYYYEDDYNEWRKNNRDTHN